MKTVFSGDVATIVTPEFMNAINNPTYSDDPQEDGQLPIPPQIAPMQDAIDALAVTIVPLPRGGIDGLIWKHANTDGSDLEPYDELFEDASPFSDVRIAPALATISIEMAFRRVDLGSSLFPVEIRLPNPPVQLASLLSTLEGRSAKVTASLITNDNVMRMFGCILGTAGTGPGQYLYAQFCELDTGYRIQYTALKDALAIIHEGDPATWATISIHASLVAST